MGVGFVKCCSVAAVRRAQLLEPMRLCEEMKGNGTGTQPNSNRETYPGIVCFWKSRWQQKGYSCIARRRADSCYSKKRHACKSGPKTGTQRWNHGGSPQLTVLSKGNPQPKPPPLSGLFSHAPQQFRCAPRLCGCHQREDFSGPCELRSCTLDRDYPEPSTPNTVLPLKLFWKQLQGRSNLRGLRDIHGLH